MGAGVRLLRFVLFSHGNPPMALLLRESHVETLLTMKTTLELVERVHREYSTGNAIDVPRERTRLPRAALHLLQGAVPSAGIFGYKAYTSSREGVRFLVYGFSAERGHLDIVVEANYLGMMRTGAPRRVAAKLPPPPRPTLLPPLRPGFASP